MPRLTWCNKVRKNVYHSCVKGKGNNIHTPFIPHERDTETRTIFLSAFRLCWDLDEERTREQDTIFFFRVQLGFEIYIPGRTWLVACPSLGGWTVVSTTAMMSCLLVSSNSLSPNYAFTWEGLRSHQPWQGSIGLEQNSFCRMKNTVQGRRRKEEEWRKCKLAQVAPTFLSLSL